MTKAEEILNEYGCPEIPFDENVTMFYPSILSAMGEYAKYCASKAREYYLREATKILKGKMDNFTNWEEYWLDFQRGEEAR